MKAQDLKYKRQRHVYLGNARRVMANLLRSACAAGFRLGVAEAVFELGCGDARLIRHLRSVSGLRLVASDLLDENAQWCRENVLGVQFHTNHIKPPLRFAGSETFDFAFAFSVFTHIPLQLQLPWLAELARIMKPGAAGTVTILGCEMARLMMNGGEYEQFLDRGFYMMDADHPRVSASSALVGSWDVFMTPEYVQALYSQVVEVVDIQPGGQQVVTFRKPVQ